MGRQPQDQLVEKEHQRVVAQVAGVTRDDGQPLVERDERLDAAPRHVAVAPEERVDQRGHQPAALLGPRRRAERRLEARRIPVGGQVPPAGGVLAGRRRGLVDAGEERRVPEPRAQPAGVVEEPLGAIDPRRRGVRVQRGNPRGVASQHGRLQARLADHVVRRQQEPLASEPVVMPGDNAFEPLRGARRRVVLQQQVEHRHEVALAAAEAAVQVTPPCWSRTRPRP